MKKITNVGIIGRGAIGSLYGSLLQNHHLQTMCFIVDKKRKQRYEQTPFFINEKKADFSYQVDGEPLDLIMITTKFAGLHDALQQIRPFVNKDTILLSCLNGISSEDICREQYHYDQVIRCIVQGMDATYLKNEMHYDHIGEILLGAENEQQSETVKALKQFFDSMHIPCRVCKDILREQWNKLMLNCGINQVCARYQCGYGECQDHGPHQKEFISAMKEVRSVAQAIGIQLHMEDIQQWIQLVNDLSPENMPSMAQDILAHRKTELPLFSGTIVPLAKQHHIPVPTLTTLMNEIKKIENTF